MRALNRKLIRDIRHNWHMLLAVSSIIAVGIGCYVGMMSAVKNLDYSRSSYYSSCRLADFWIDLKKIPTQDVKRLAAIPGISEIRNRIQFEIILDLPESPKPVSAMVLSLPDVQTPVINNIVLRKGTYFTDNRANEVIVSEKFAKARNIDPGDTISAILNNQRKELIVTGIAISAEFIYVASPGSMIDEPGSYGLLFLKRSFAEDIFGFNSACNSIAGLLAPEAKSDAKRIVEELSDKLSPYGVFAGLPRSEQFSPMVLDGEMKQLKSMAFIFPLVFLVVAALVLNVLMIRLAEQQRTVIGTLKAIGYENPDLILHFVKFAATAGIAGGFLGCLLGYWLGEVTTQMYLDYFTFPQLSNAFYPGLSLFGVCVSVLFAILGTLKGVRNIMQLEPAEAMRQATPPVGGAVLLERFGLFWKNIDAQWQMIIRGLLRNKGRTFIAIFSATMGSSIVILAFGFVDSMDKMVTLQFEKVLRSDYHLTFNKEINYSAIDEIRRLPGVTYAEPLFIVPCTFKLKNHNKRGAITGIVSGSQLTIPLNSSGETVDVPANGLLMAKRLMNKLEIRAGNHVNVIPVKGERLLKKLPVLQGIDSMLGLAVYADYHWLNHVFGQQNVISEVRILASHSSVEKKRFMELIRGMPELQSLTDLGEQKEALNRQLNGAMRASAFVMILFAAVIFFGTILNGTLVAISERRREIATFRTMGYFDNEVARLFLRENLVNNVLGTLFGLPIGYWMLKISMQGFVSDAYSFPAALATKSYVYTMILAIGFVLLSQQVVKWNLKKQNWAEALSLKE